MRKAVAVFVLVAFALLVVPQNLLAAGPRSVTSAELHQAVQASHVRAVAARKAVNDILCRADVETQMRQAGLVPDKVRAQVASLSDTEMLRLQKQLMTNDLQQTRAGLSTGAIIGIVVAGVAGLILLTVLLYAAVEDTYYYY